MWFDITQAKTSVRRFPLFRSWICSLILSGPASTYGLTSLTSNKLADSHAGCALLHIEPGRPARLTEQSPRGREQLASADEKAALHSRSASICPTRSEWLLPWDLYPFAGFRRQKSTA